MQMFQQQNTVHALAYMVTLFKVNYQQCYGLGTKYISLQRASTGFKQHKSHLSHSFKAHMVHRSCVGHRQRSESRVVTIKSVVKIYMQIIYMEYIYKLLCQ